LSRRTQRPINISRADIKTPKTTIRLKQKLSNMYCNATIKYEENIGLVSSSPTTKSGRQRQHAGDTRGRNDTSDSLKRSQKLPRRQRQP
jgi:hypothetical protein